MLSFAAAPSTIIIGAHSAHPLTVCRLGYGTMRLTGPGIWGEPANRAAALEILRTAPERGTQLLDTADYYGEDVTNRLIAEALHPYPDGLVICTKVGATRLPDKSWVAYNRPEEIRRSIDNNLRTLRLEQLPVVHFRIMPDATTPFAESLDVLFLLQAEGKIGHVGLSNVNLQELEEGLARGPIATVENRFGYSARTNIAPPLPGDRGGAAVLALCAERSIPMLPYYSLATALPEQEDRIAAIARKYAITPAQVHIAWLLHHSPWMLPIPGTSSLRHFAENMAAASVALTAEDMAYLG